MGVEVFCKLIWLLVGKNRGVEVLIGSLSKLRVGWRLKPVFHHVFPQRYRGTSGQALTEDLKVSWAHFLNRECSCAAHYEAMLL